MPYILIVFNITCNYIISQRQFILCAILFMCHIYSNIYSHLVKLSAASCRVASICTHVCVYRTSKWNEMRTKSFLFHSLRNASGGDTLMHSLLLQLKKVTSRSSIWIKISKFDNEPILFMLWLHVRLPKIYYRTGNLIYFTFFIQNSFYEIR